MSSLHHPKPIAPKPARDAGAKTRKRSHRKSTRRRVGGKPRTNKVPLSRSIQIDVVSKGGASSNAFTFEDPDPTAGITITAHGPQGTAMMRLLLNEAGEIVMIEPESFSPRALPDDG